MQIDGFLMRRLNLYYLNSTLFQYGAGDAFGGPQSAKHGLSGEEIENKSKFSMWNFKSEWISCCSINRESRGINARMEANKSYFILRR